MFQTRHKNGGVVSRERWVVVSSFRRECTATNSNCRPSLSLSLSTFSLLLSQLMHHWLLHNISLSLFHSFSLSSTACTPSDCWRPKGNAKKKSMIIINFFFSGFEFCWWLVAVMIDSSVEFLHQGWFDFAFLLESNGGFLFSRVTEQWKIYDSKF